MVIRTYRDLDAYKISFDLAMNLFRVAKSFPTEERFSLTDNMRRAARSVPTNIAEGWAKRKYENVFKRHLIDAIGSCEEVKVWLEFSVKSGYMEAKAYDSLANSYNRLGAMLSSLLKNWKTY